MIRLRGITFHYSTGDVKFTGSKAAKWYNNFKYITEFASRHGQNPFDNMDVLGDFFPRKYDGEFEIELDESYHKTPKKDEYWFKTHDGKTKILDSLIVKIFHPQNAKISWEERLKKLRTFNKIKRVS